MVQKCYSKGVNTHATITFVSYICKSILDTVIREEVYPHYMHSYKKGE